MTGGVRLVVPSGYRGRWLSDPADRELVARWASASRELCAYNTPAYVEFARRRNGRADLLWLERDGNPMLGLPLHPHGRSSLRTGYSGMLFAGAPGEAPLRRGVSALRALLDANPRLGLRAEQAASAPAYDDPPRIAALSFLLERHGLRGPPLYSRVLELAPLDDLGRAPELGGESELGGRPRLGSRLELGGELSLEEGLEPYQAELRNQIRQALRRGLRVICSLPSSEPELEAAYAEFLELHRESWSRTGLTPHERDYWIALARAILDGGGRDLIVEARDGDGTLLAAVTCHLFGARALYWAGASSEAGLRARANPLCLHGAIQACRQLGVRHFELGRIDARESSPKELAITRYKAQFGGALVRVAAFQTRPRRLRALAGEDSLGGLRALDSWRTLSALRARARGAADRRRRRPPG
jgi:hypothetical protein